VERARHTAELYVHDDELVASVSSFLKEGLAIGVPGVVVATPDHRRAIRDAVGSELLEADAEETLAQLLVNGKPGAVAFERVIGALLDRANGPVRVYGEMVSLLCERDEVAAAMVLEELWNDLLRTRPVTLHCGYRLDVFDLTVQTGPLPHICRLHSQVDPAHDEARFTRAVDRAMTAVLGQARTEDVHYIVSRDRKPRVPAAQEALRWLSLASPRLAAHVLAAARERYTAAA
jgi:MEDS: MEthanogen/methylotroph, DcmR Sensory domain